MDESIKAQMKHTLIVAIQKWIDSQVERNQDNWTDGVGLVGQNTAAYMAEAALAVLVAVSDLKRCHSVSQSNFAPLLTGPSATAIPKALALVQREQELPDSQPWLPATRPTRLVRQEWIEVDPNQMWYWTAGWQAQEREAEDDFCAGRYEEFMTMDDFISSLPSEVA